jgi:hypothetical protein
VIQKTTYFVIFIVFLRRLHRGPLQSYFFQSNFFDHFRDFCPDFDQNPGGCDRNLGDFDHAFDHDHSAHPHHGRVDPFPDMVHGDLGNDHGPANVLRDDLFDLDLDLFRFSILK